MDIQSKNKGKDVYAVKKLFSKRDLLDFVSDGGLIRYKRTKVELDRSRKEYKTDIKVSTYLNMFVVFAFLSMFIINFNGEDTLNAAGIVKGLVVFIVPCITSVIALLKYTDYKEQYVKKYSLDMENLKEKHPIARKFSYEELVDFSSISKKLCSSAEELDFYQVSESLITEGKEERSILVIYNNETKTWSVIEYLLDNTRLEAYKMYDVTPESPIAFQ